MLVTNNAGDFLKLAVKAGLHSGLVFIELGSAAAEAEWLSAAISHIEARAADENETTAQFMVNRVIEVDDSGYCTDYPLAVAWRPSADVRGRGPQTPRSRIRLGRSAA